jgi:ketosteroid isomerase-like protein
MSQATRPPTPEPDSGDGEHIRTPILITKFMGVAAMARDFTKEDSNKALVQASFDRWKSGTGGPFELLAHDAEWTIVGSSPLAKTYHSKTEFIDQVIDPFNARMSKPLVPTVRGIFADGDMVIILFDAEATVRDGKSYRNTYTWYFQIRDAKVVKAIAFFDNKDFDEFWNRVSPTP